MNMFCYQCEQTAKGAGCTAHGVCGKDPDTAALQDLLVYAVKDIARYAHRAYQYGKRDAEVDVYVVEALFATVTNVNFNPEDLLEMLRCGVDVRRKAEDLYRSAVSDAGEEPEQFSTPVPWWESLSDVSSAVNAGEEVSIQKRMEELGEDVTGLQELMTYGLKGAAAYMDHARILGKEDEAVWRGFHAALDYLTRRPKDAAELQAWCMKVGELNLKVMELLDAGHNERLGRPEPTQVRVTPKAGKCIAVSGHDMLDLKMLLEQTEGKGINVYTHSEMLMGNAYPELKKHEHFVGNYGGAWQDQRQEFDDFPGAILMTTNCLQAPKDSYKDRIFTTSVVSWPGVEHIEADANGHKDFTPVIEAALAAPGFAEDAEEKYTMTGFGHHALGEAAEAVVNAVKNGDIRHFFLIGGCDGAKPGRNYYTEFAEKVPDDCVILTLACGKYRFNKLPFGDIGGIPRMLDCGQCNDAYSAIRIAVALAEAFDCEVNELPLSFILSWFEQKAVAILLTLLHLGITDMRLGPTIPAFTPPNILKVLNEQFNLMPIGTVEEDLQACLA